MIVWNKFEVVRVTRQVVLQYSVVALTIVEDVWNEVWQWLQMNFGMLDDMTISFWILKFYIHSNATKKRPFLHQLIPSQAKCIIF